MPLSLDPVVLPGLPTLGYHAASKAYVDAQRSAALGTESVTTSVTLDASASSVRRLSCTTATLAIAVPTNPFDQQILRIRVRRSTAAVCDVTFNGSIMLSTGLASRTFSVSSGKALISALEYDADAAAWVLTAATVSS